MAEGLNKVFLLGNLGADPELRYTQGGQAVLNLRMACTESYLDKDKVRQERTEWVNVTIWGKRGEALGKFLSKGSPLMVEGRMQTSSYDDREGVKRYKTEVVAINVCLVGSKNGCERSEGGGYRGPQRQQTQQKTPPADDFGDAPPDDFGAGGFGGDDDITF